MDTNSPLEPPLPNPLERVVTPVPLSARLRLSISAPFCFLSFPCFTLPPPSLSHTPSSLFNSRSPPAPPPPLRLRSPLLRFPLTSFPHLVPSPLSSFPSWFPSSHPTYLTLVCSPLFVGLLPFPVSYRFLPKPHTRFYKTTTMLFRLLPENGRWFRAEQRLLLKRSGRRGGVE